MIEHKVITIKEPSDTKELEDMLNGGWVALHALPTDKFILYILQKRKTPDLASLKK